jgi:uncharacterized protein
MLITFKISNFLSFDKEIVFSMQAGRVETFPHHYIKGKSRNEINILKSSLIYGANASGKSNFIKAIEFAKKLITKGLKDTYTENKHFRLDENKLSAPTQFEFEFKHNDKMYAYGVVLSLSERKIKEEWLFELMKTTDKPIFERKVAENGKSEINLSLKFDAEGQARFNVYKKDIKDNQLFLAEINDKDIDDIPNIKPFQDAFDWFKNEIVIIYPHTEFEGLDFIGNNKEMQTSFCHFLSLFNTGIEGIETIEQEVEEDFPSFLKEKILNELHEKGENAAISVKMGKHTFSFSKNKENEVKLFKLKTKHKIRNSYESVYFDIPEESDGTQRILDLIPAFVAMTRTNRTYFIDEIDRSLHPELTQKMIQLFLNNTQNTESQLIATTHESSLLDLSFLRRDEIWFVEKDKEGASQMYSLEQFKPRYDKEIGKSYLLGRFSAIPFISSVENLGWLQELAKNKA